MKIPTVPLPLLFVSLLLIATQTCRIYRFTAEAKIHITDDLDDVVDDEEDEAWKEWGKKKTPQPEFDPPPTDFAQMDPAKMQEEMMKRQFGPVFGFAKLRPGSRRTQDEVSEIARKWSKVARTGAIQVKFSVVDLSTIMFTMEKGQDSLELKVFILDQPEAYEVKIGEQLYRRAGDPPFDEVFAKLQAEKHRSEETNSIEDEKHQEL